LGYAIDAALCELPEWIFTDQMFVVMLNLQWQGTGANDMAHDAATLQTFEPTKPTASTVETCWWTEITSNYIRPHTHFISIQFHLHPFHQSISKCVLKPIFQFALPR